MRKALLAAMLVAVTAASPARAISDAELRALYDPYAGDSQLALDKPHRSGSELTAWVSEIVGVILDFSAGKAGKHLAEIRPYFSDKGYASFVAFLNAQGYGEAISKQTLTLKAIVNSAPTLVGQGASGGRYAWIYEMPTAINVTTAAGQAPFNQTASLRVQVGRNARGADPHGLLIENWSKYQEAKQYVPSDPMAGPQ